MASHRSSKSPSRAATVTMVGLAAGTVAMVPNVGEAAPAQTFAQVQAEVNSLNAQADAGTQNYDADQQAYAQLQQRIDGLQSQIVTDTAQTHELQKSMGLQAGAQYQQDGVSEALQLALTANPDAYLNQASVINESGQQDAARLKQLEATQVQLKQDVANAANLVAEQLATVRQQAVTDANIKSELSKAQSLLNTLTAQQQAEVENGGNGTAQTTFTGVLPPVSGRAAVAVAYAKSKLGDEYVRGGNGPSIFDCSGLTQESWKAAGVGIERTSYEQYASLPHIPISDLQPGDLVFFFGSSEGPQHVGIYVGDGELIHAPHPGTVVQYASLYGSDMPIVGAARVD
jgi:peptidoglycan DL-endopeptidase CwlO